MVPVVSLVDVIRPNSVTSSARRGLVRRAWSAYRRVGLRGLWDYLKWRFHVGARRVAHTEDEASTPDLHRWTATFAHDAAFSAHFDLDLAALEANREVVERYEERATEVSTASWFLTYFDHVLYGGVHTILRLMDHMTRKHGVAHRLVLFDRTGVKDHQVREVVARAFPSLDEIDIVLPDRGAIPYEELPYTDIGVATMWISAYPLARFNNVGAKFYMVQDFEPDFYPAGSLSALADATYRFGFAGIANTPGLATVYRSYGNPTVEFTPAVDYLEEAPEKPTSPEEDLVQIVVYGRPSTDRNAFELVAAACTKVKEAYGDRVRVVSAGEDWDPADLGLDGVIENRGRLDSLAAVRELYEESDIGVCFMLSKHPSYQPFEYLASNVVPVCNVNPATSWFLRDEENCLITEPFPSEVARTISRLIDDEGLRHKIAEVGHAEVAELDWDTQFDRVWRFVTKQT